MAGIGVFWWRRFRAALLIVLSCAAPVLAETAAEALKRPGTFAIMRHALAPGTGDPAGFTLGDCTTQRNLDAAGRRQARSTGAALRKAGIVFGRILSSQWCRCLETARLMALGPVEELPALNSFYENRAAADGQTRALRQFLKAAPMARPVLLVTHQVNITALTGRPASSGEVLILEIGAGGALRHIGSILIDP